MKKKLIPSILLFLTFLIFFFIWFMKKDSDISCEIQALKYQGHIYFTRPEIYKEITKSKIINKKIEKENWEYLLKITQKKNVFYYFFNDPSCLYEFQKQKVLISNISLKQILTEELQKITKNNPYGVLLSWEEVQKIFPKMSKGTVRDLETGLRFNIQRRAGREHADVQPLKASDTKIFKKIYGGKWSWKRRAVVFEKNGFKIAASMHGMPHGQGAIRGNNFPGHFCLHFYNSRTHSGNLDLAHQLMVWKAAGFLEDYLYVRTPEEMVEIALTAIKQNDIQLVLFSFLLDENITKIINYMGKIASLKIDSIKKGDLENSYIAKIQWYELRTGKNYKKEINLRVKKVNNRYLVTTEGILKGFFI